MSKDKKVAHWPIFFALQVILLVFVIAIWDVLQTTAVKPVGCTLDMFGIPDRDRINSFCVSKGFDFGWAATNFCDGKNQVKCLKRASDPKLKDTAECINWDIWWGLK